MRPIRIGAVDYLNARPLVHGLDRQTDRFQLRFDPPSRCASLLHEGEIDIGLIPSVEYLGHPEYAIVPDVAIASKGRVDSVALFSARPLKAIQSIALDSSSRTSVALLRVLCARSFDIEPAMITLGPDLTAMLTRCDAALLIGDAALFTDPAAAGVAKIDLGEAWMALTGLPFVWAFWAGRHEVFTPEFVRVLQHARDSGVRAIDEIARAYCPGDDRRAAQGADYLRQHIQFDLGEAHRAGLQRFLGEVMRLKLAPAGGELRFAAMVSS
jgi:chorismate dehydratase